MRALAGILLALFLGQAISHGETEIPSYTSHWFTQKVDHFNQEDTRVWQQRYLVWSGAWDGEGPIFFYTGNEGSIISFWNNTGFVFEIAPKFNALVIFAEHRYYGESWPFGSAGASLSKPNVGYLSVEQALADYAYLVQQLKGPHHYNIPAAPVIAFGGSYGGMLSAWFRMKYPNVCDAAIAASAPIKMGTGGVSFVAKPRYFETVTNDFKKYHLQCPGLVQQGFQHLSDLAKKGSAGLGLITKEFSLCKPLAADHLEHLQLWISNSFGNLAMMNYPYPTDFLAPLPAWPVKLACQMLVDSPSPLRGLAKAAGLFYNGTNGTLTCFDIDTEFVECADQTGCGTGPGGQAWDYQACTEIIYFPDTDNQTDMFPPRKWTIDDLTQHCMSTWGIKPDPDWLGIYTGGSNLAGASKIVFSNGLLDPWHGGGFLHDHSDSLVSVIIEDGAHHLDLRGSHPLDPPSVTAAREKEVQLLKKWLDAK